MSNEHNSDGVADAPRRPPVHVPPTLGATVDEVMRAFERETLEWSGLGYVEAMIPVTDAGPSRRHRFEPACYGGKVGVVEAGGWGLRSATEAELDELELAVRKGWVQITRVTRLPRAAVVLHQATGREIPNM
jgi:hypothetical protein